MNKLKNGDKSGSIKDDIRKNLMKHKLQDAIKCTVKDKKELNVSKDNLTKVVRQGTFVRREFMEIVDKELKSLWTESKVKNKE